MCKGTFIVRKIGRKNETYRHLKIEVKLNNTNTVIIAWQTDNDRKSDGYKYADWYGGDLTIERARAIEDVKALATVFKAAAGGEDYMNGGPAEIIARLTAAGFERIFRVEIACPDNSRWPDVEYLTPGDYMIARIPDWGKYIIKDTKRQNKNIAVVTEKILEFDGSSRLTAWANAQFPMQPFTVTADDDAVLLDPNA